VHPRAKVTIESLEVVYEKSIGVKVTSTIATLAAESGTSNEAGSSGVGDFETAERTARRCSAVVTMGEQEAKLSLG